MVGQELERVRVRRVFGLDEDGTALLLGREGGVESPPWLLLKTGTSGRTGEGMRLSAAGAGAGADGSGSGSTLAQTRDGCRGGSHGRLGDERH